MQTTINREPSRAVAGQTEGAVHAVSRITETDGLLPGLGVIKGTGTNAVIKPTGTPADADFDGVVMLDPTRGMTDSGVASFADNTPVPVLKRGEIWVPVAGTALVDHGPVYLIRANANAGKFSGAAGSGDDTAVLLTGCRCVVGGATSSIAKVSFVRP